MTKQSLTRWTLCLCLLISTSSLTGCVHPPTNPPVDTSWVKPIYFHPATLDWLASIPNWPPTAYDDFDLIRKHNEKYERIHGLTRPAPAPATQPTTKP